MIHFIAISFVVSALGALLYAPFAAALDHRMGSKVNPSCEDCWRGGGSDQPCECED
jgi:hypothetical protein